MAGYTKEFLVDAFCWRYERVGLDSSEMRKMADSHYDKVGKDQFRIHCSLDADYIKRFKADK